MNNTSEKDSEPKAEMTFFLGLNVLGHSEHIIISQEQFEETKAAKDALIYALTIEELMDHVLENYLEWEKDLLASAVDTMIRFDIDDIQEKRRLITRRLINILTTCRMFVDQSKHITKKICRSIDSEEINKIFNNKYDSSLSYRIMEALRNFTQHYGSPIHRLTLDQRRLEKYDNLIFGIIPHLETLSIMDDNKFKPSVAEEIKNIKESKYTGKIDLRIRVREYISELSDAHGLIREKIKQDIEKADNLILKCINDFSLKYPDSELTGLSIFVRNEKGVEIHHISENFIKKRKSFESRTHNLGHLSKSIAISDDLKLIKNQEAQSR